MEYLMDVNISFLQMRSLNEFNRIRMEKAEEFVKNQEVKKMMKETLTSDDKKQFEKGI